MRKGLDETEVQAALGDLDAASAGGDVLPAKTIAALRLVDLLVDDHPVVDGDAYQRLRGDFDDGEILELAAVIAIGSGWQKMIEAFGIRPDKWSDATPLPWQGER